MPLPLSDSLCGTEEGELIARCAAIGRGAARSSSPTQAEDRQAFRLAMKLRTLATSLDVELGRSHLKAAADAYADEIRRLRAAATATLSRLQEQGSQPTAEREATQRKMQDAEAEAKRPDMDPTVLLMLLVEKWATTTGSAVIARAFLHAARAPLKLRPPLDDLGPLLVRIASAMWHLQRLTDQQQSSADGSIYLSARTGEDMLNVPHAYVTSALKVLASHGVLTRVKPAAAHKSPTYRFNLSSPLYEPPAEHQTAVGADQAPECLTYTLRAPHAAATSASTTSMAGDEEAAPSDVHPNARRTDHEPVTPR